MQKGKNPNWDQKKLLTKNKLNYSEWLVIKNYPDSYEFRNKNTDEVIKLPKIK